MDEIKKCVSVTHDICKEFEDRLGHMEAKMVKTTELSESSTVCNQELMERLGTLEAKIISFEETRASQTQIPSSSHTGRLANSERHPNTGSAENVIHEIYNMKSRENNIVIYGVPESGLEMTSERVTHDHTFARKIMQVCGITACHDKIYKVSRLGKAMHNKHRPILLKFTDTMTKPKIFKNIKNLKGVKDYEGVRIAYDLTKRERDLEAELWKEAKNLKNAGKGLHRVVGPPWKRRIVKLKDNQQVGVQRETEQVEPPIVQQLVQDVRRQTTTDQTAREEAQKGQEQEE